MAASVFVPPCIITRHGPTIFLFNRGHIQSCNNPVIQQRRTTQIRQSWREWRLGTIMSHKQSFPTCNVVRRCQASRAYISGVGGVAKTLTTNNRWSIILEVIVAEHERFMPVNFYYYLLSVLLRIWSYQDIRYVRVIGLYYQS